MLSAMSSGSTNHHRRIRPWQRKRCDARVKNPIKIGNNGVRVARSLRCRAWAMESGRCRVHGGASTGPKSPEGKARVVAAMVEGRRKWVARRRAEGRRFTAGRKRAERWTTEPMRERARAEARRLGGGRFTLDQPLVLALLKSAKGDRVWEAKAKAMLAAHEQAEADRDRGHALSLVRDLRARAIAGWSGRAAVPTTLPFAEVGANAYAPTPYAPTGSGEDPTTPAAKLRRNLFLALDLLEEIMMGKAPDRNVRDKRLAARSRYGDNKGGHCDRQKYAEGSSERHCSLTGKLIPRAIWAPFKIVRGFRGWSEIFRARRRPCRSPSCPKYLRSTAPPCFKGWRLSQGLKCRGWLHRATRSRQISGSAAEGDITGEV